MSVIESAVKYFRAAGMAAEEIVDAILELESALQDERRVARGAYLVGDEQAERRRAKDRDRKRNSAEFPQKSAENETAPDPPKVPPCITPLNTPSEPKGSGATAPLPGIVIHLDARTKLFNEGKLALEAMGVPAGRCGALVGKWLRDQNDDAEAVLAVIQRAEAERVVEAIPWITAALGHLKVQRNARPNSAIQQALDAALAQVRG